jgi:hypothetical protein
MQHTIKPFTSRQISHQKSSADSSDYFFAALFIAGAVLGAHLFDLSMKLYRVGGFEWGLGLLFGVIAVSFFSAFLFIRN